MRSLRPASIVRLWIIDQLFQTIPRQFSHQPRDSSLESWRLTKGGNDPSSVKAGQEAARLNKLVRERLHANVKARHGDISYEQFRAEHKRFLISPQDVRLIDSVYRIRDAAAARRGLKKLDKWWKEDDETLLQVQTGALL